MNTKDTNRKDKIFINLVRITTVLVFVVIVLGAYVRLSNAGLSCPDWPGCYGQIIVPANPEAVLQANEVYPDKPLEKGKAWKEMTHRYVASTLGLLILIMTLITWVKSQYSNMRVFTTILLGLVIFQGLLGMWTVTLLLKPVIVVLHLLGGLTLLSLLYWMVLRQQSRLGVFVSAGNRKLLPLAITALLVLGLQISLGGWTSSNYAALACPDFPNCQGQWWPNMDFNEGFILWRGLGIDYEGGVLQGSARTAIHMAHRIGAIITSIIILVTVFRVILTGMKQLRSSGFVALTLLLLQVSLGIANIKLGLPIVVAVAHNGVAALLLLSLVTLLHHCLPENKQKI